MTPDMNFSISPMSPDAQSVSTMASTNKKSDGELEMVFDEDDSEATECRLSKSGKGPHSKERKMSSEDYPMLPPRAKDSKFLRPQGKFDSNIPISKPLDNSSSVQQPLKPMTILGFLQNATSQAAGVSKVEGVEKAENQSFKAFSLASSLKGTDAKIPSFTLG